MATMTRKEYEELYTFIKNKLNENQIESLNQLFFGLKFIFNDLDLFCLNNEENHVKIATLFKEFNYSPAKDGNGIIDKNRFIMTVDNKIVEFKFVSNVTTASFSGSFSGLYYILVLPMITSFYDHRISVNMSGYVTLNEVGVTTEMMTFHEFLLIHGVLFPTNQVDSFSTEKDFFEAMSKLSFYNPLFIVNKKKHISHVTTSEKRKKSIEPKEPRREDKFYFLFNDWLRETGIDVEVLNDTILQENTDFSLLNQFCVQNCSLNYLEHTIKVQSKKEEMKLEEDAVQRTSVKNLLPILKEFGVNIDDKTLLPDFGRLSKFALGKNIKISEPEIIKSECEQIRNAFISDLNINIAIVNAVPDQWNNYIKLLWKKITS
jgi:hypothetical protein